MFVFFWCRYILVDWLVEVAVMKVCCHFFCFAEKKLWAVLLCPCSSWTTTLTTSINFVQTLIVFSYSSLVKTCNTSLWCPIMFQDFPSQIVHVAVNCVDQYLMKRKVQRSELQLLGITCMLIAARFVLSTECISVISVLGILLCGFNSEYANWWKRCGYNIVMWSRNQGFCYSLGCWLFVGAREHPLLFVMYDLNYRYIAISDSKVQTL